MTGVGWSNVHHGNPMRNLRSTRGRRCRDGAGQSALAAMLLAGCALDWPPPLQREPQPPSDCTRCPLLAARVPAPSSPWTTVTVPPGGDLQAALDGASAGDEIVLQAGATYAGSFRLPVTHGDGYVTVRTSAIDRLPGPCTRLTSDDTGALARIVAPAGKPAILAADGAHHVRLIGLELSVADAASTEPPDAVVMIGTGTEVDTTLLPHDIELDRVHVLGSAPRSADGIALNGGATALVNSLVTNIDNDAEARSAVVATNGPGPYVVLNDYLESYGAALRVGEVVSTIAGVVPSDIELRYSVATRRRTWRKYPAYGAHSVELRNARRVRIEGNALLDSWEGFDVTISPTQGGVLEDITITSNLIRGGIEAFGILTTVPNAVAKVTIANNLVYEMDGKLLTLSGTSAGIVATHNTVLQGAHIFIDDSTVTGFVFDDNIARHNDYGMFCDTIGLGTMCLDANFPGYEVRRNVIIGLPLGTKPSAYPPDNFFPAYDVGFVDQAANDYHLAPTSPYKNAATDGKDIGVVFDAYDAAAQCRSPDPP